MADAGTSHPYRPRRRRGRLGPVLGVLLGLVLVAVPGVAWMAWNGLQARERLTAAIPAVEQLQDEIAAGDGPAAEQTLARLQDDTADARRRTSGPLWWLERKAVYLFEGLGHALMALDEGTAIVYLCSEGYAPTREFGVHPLDPELGIAWPTEDRHGNPLTPSLSAKDEAAPSRRDALDEGLLPDLDACVRYQQQLVERGGL